MLKKAQLLNFMKWKIFHVDYEQFVEETVVRKAGRNIG